ncbi:FHA domain-containing protein [Leucobacter chromiireducens]|nr:FHA domain-containing protein [Leucobacter chromiireducens]
MQRLATYTPRTLAETEHPRPVAIAPPAAGGKKRRKKQSTNVVTAPSAPWAATPPAGGPVEAMPVFSASRPVAVVAPTAFATPIAPAAASEASGRDEATRISRVSRGDAADEATIVSRVATGWAVELESGVVVSLPSHDVVIGRRPDATGDATPVSLPDPSRSLSRTHARLRRDTARDIWTIEDLASANGVATVSDSGYTTWIASGVPSKVSQYFRLGDIRARLVRVATRDTGHATSAAAQSDTQTTEQPDTRQP